MNKLSTDNWDLTAPSIFHSEEHAPWCKHSSACTAQSHHGLLCEPRGSGGIHCHWSDVVFLPKVGSLWCFFSVWSSCLAFSFFCNRALMFPLSQSLPFLFWHGLSKGVSFRSASAHACSIAKSLCSWNTLLVELRDSYSSKKILSFFLPILGDRTLFLLGLVRNCFSIPR